MEHRNDQSEAYLAEPLTRREMEILSLLADGLSNREVAGMLTLAHSTVKWYTKQIYGKLGAHSRRSAVDHARELGLLGELTSVNSLPLETTKFIGREDELRRITEDVKDPGCRLITLVGLGGAGKTRLAIRAASELTRQESSLFKDGIHFIPLEAHRDASMLVPAIASVLNFPLSGTDEPFEQLVKYLRNKRIMLVLDNFEQLLDGTDQVARILQRTTRIKMLVTSREALNLSEEWRVELSGFPLPDPAKDDVFDNSAVQLFIERASHVRTDFSEEDNISCIADICRLVVGLPLAIELAATWIRSLNCDEIANEIESNLELLEASLRNIPERHKSLRIILDQSWSRLSEKEKDVCRNLSVFRGGFSLSAAKNIAGASPTILTALIDKAMIRRDRSDHYQMHDLINKYAGDRLARSAVVEQEVRDRHRVFFSSLASSYQASWENHNQLLALKLFKSEVHNLRQAWEWSLRQADYQRLDQMLFSICEFYFWQGRLKEGIKLCRQVVENVHENGAGFGADRNRATLLCAKALLWESIFITQSQNTVSARSRIEAAQDLLDEILPEEQDRAFIQAHVWLQRGRMALSLGDLADAKMFLNHSLRAFGELDEMWGAAASWYWLGLLAWLVATDEEALDAHNNSLSLFIRTGDRRNIASVKDALGINLRNLEQWDRALELQLEAITIARRLQDPLRIGWINHSLTWTYYEIGNFQGGAETGQESVAAAEDVGNDFILAAGQASLAGCLLHLGHFEQALRLAESSYSITSKGVLWQPFVPLTLGNAALVLGQSELAYEMITRSSKILLEQRLERASIPLSCLSLAAFVLGKQGEAEEHLKKALTLAIQFKKQ